MSFIFFIIFLTFVFGGFKMFYLMKQTLNYAQLAISTQEVEIKENEDIKKYFIDYNSIYEMDENTKYYFCKYILNHIYITKDIINEFSKSLNEKFGKAFDKEVDSRLDDASINTDNIVILINESLRNYSLKEKTFISDNCIIGYIDRSGGSGEYSWVTTDYYKVTLIKENDLDLILNEIKETGSFSFNYFIKEISKSEYEKYLS